MTSDQEQAAMADRALDMRAVLMLDVAESLPHHYSRNGKTLPPVAAFQSPALVSSLMKLGMFSMNFSAIIDQKERNSGDGSVPFSKIPSFLLGVGIHYAIEVAPTIGDEPDASVISLDRLEAHVTRIEREFGTIPVDMSLIDRITVLAKDKIMRDAPGPQEGIV